MARDADLIKGTILHRRMQLGEAVTTTTRCLLGKIGVARFFVAMAPRLVGSSLVSRGDAECVRSGCAAESSPARTECGLCSPPLVGWLGSAARRRLSRFLPHWPPPTPTTQDPTEEGRFGGQSRGGRQRAGHRRRVGLAAGGIDASAACRTRARRACLPRMPRCTSGPRADAEARPFGRRRRNITAKHREEASRFPHFPAWFHERTRALFSGSVSKRLRL